MLFTGTLNKNPAITICYCGTTTQSPAKEFKHASNKFQSTPIPRRMRLVIASRMVTI
ncbi:hypothetical protein M407DRAFT_241034 [Tulasnella calospora MUT 4182]|uniref:Uncharacterized protein n=1 Tax=Tulasnella calospora MUT 4182 TaxID=1051891 RepID=A0A0C3QWT2_9AGAM|nr:hypothetical protein M407DRAFT_241034 [Tulasnella calospora MUT 4182]